MRFVLSSVAMRRTSSLLDGSPGTIAKCPPRSALAPASVSSRSLLLRLRLVGAVAGIAAVGEDRADVAVELHRSGGGGDTAAPHGYQSQPAMHSIYFSAPRSSAAAVRP